MLTAIAKPFGWLLMLLYEFVGNYGIAVILFALIVKLILLPFQMKSKRSMMQTSRLQPRLKELEKKHGANKAKYNEEVSKLYRESGVHPMSGCLWSLIPFPILIALYQAIRYPLTIMMGVSQSLLQEGGAIYELLTKLGFSTQYNDAYIQIAQSQFISQPEHFSQFAEISDKLRQIDYSFLGLDLGAQPKWNMLWTTDWSDSSIWLPALGLFLIPIISAALSFLSSKISTKMNSTGDPQQNSMKSLLFIMPLISLYIAFAMPAALGVYWIASTLFAIIQDIILTKHYGKIIEAEESVRLEQERKREAELEAKRKETERLRAENNTKVNPNTSKRKKQASAKQEQIEKANEWEKKNKPKKDEKAQPPGAVGSRRYARGRAYDPNRYGDPPADASIAEDISAEDALALETEDFVPEDELNTASETDEATLTESEASAVDESDAEIEPENFESDEDYTDEDDTAAEDSTTPDEED
jgi:YidC/Oxa1 family membrane protein insertase